MNPANPNIPIIEFVENDDQLNAVCKFRYKTYIEELGTTYGQISLDDGLLKDELDEFGVTVFAKDGDEIIATARMNMGSNGHFEDYWFDCYNLHDFPDIQKVCLISKMMIAPKWRKTALSFHILGKIYFTCKEAGMHFLFLDCVPPLVRVYEKAGLRRYKDNAPEAMNLKYYVPMVGLIEDHAYLELTKSPFQAFTKHLPSDPTSAIWFNSYCPKGIGYTYEPLIPVEKLWEAIGGSTDHIPLFKGISDTEIKSLLHQCTFLKCKKGEHLIYQGDTGDEMYLLLEGVFEKQQKEKERIIARQLLHKGSLLGSISHNLTTPRLESFVAYTDATVMAITASLWRALQKNQPATFKRLNTSLASLQNSVSWRV